MKHLSKCLALVLAAALVLGLAACGKDTTGDDWRASGVVTDYGTIARDGRSTPGLRSAMALSFHLVILPR